MTEPFLRLMSISSSIIHQLQGPSLKGEDLQRMMEGQPKMVECLMLDLMLLASQQHYS